MRLNVTLISVVVAAALLFGCGGGGGSGGSTGTAAGSSTGTTTTNATSTNASGGSAGSAPLTKAEFIKQGDAICGKVPTSYRAKLAELEKEKPKPTKAEANLKAAVPPLFTAVAELEELGAPSGDEPQIEAIVDALEGAAKGLETNPESELTGPKSPFAEFQKLTKEYGFKGCSQL